MCLLITLRKEFKKPRQIGNTHFDYGESWRKVCHNSHITMTSTMTTEQRRKETELWRDRGRNNGIWKTKEEMKRQAERNKEKYT